MHFTKLVYITFVLVSAVEPKAAFVLIILVRAVLMVKGSTNCWLKLLAALLPLILEIFSWRMAG
jgi:hypothetical protein